MRGGRIHWRAGMLVTLLCLGASGCRPLLSTPPGCEEGQAECEPTPPESAAEVRLISPRSLREPAATPPLFGRFLPVELELSRFGTAGEVELMCGERRLATWWPSAAENEVLTLQALVDLLACRSPGTSDHPLPVTLSLFVEDDLGARHPHGTFPLLVDLTVEEGELETPGDPSAPASARLEFLDAPPTADGTPVLLRVDGLLAQPPEVTVGGARREVWPVREGWRFYVPPPDFSADIDALELEVAVQLRLTTGLGIATLIHKRLVFDRVLRTLPLQGDLFSAIIPKPAAWPVMGPEGLVMVMEDAASTLGDTARLAWIPADPAAPAASLTFARDTWGSLEGCALPGDPSQPSATCILGMNGRGQLVVRLPQPAPRDFLIAVLAPDAFERWTPESGLAELLQPAVVDPAPFSQPRGWARLGEGLLCSEARTSSCFGQACGPFPRACMSTTGAVELLPPLTPPNTPWDAGPASRARGSAQFFLTYDHLFSLDPNLPLVTVGTVTEGQRPLAVGGGSGLWFYQRGLSAVVPVRDGWALLSHAGISAFYPGTEAQDARSFSGAWMDGRYASHSPVHLEPDGSLIVIGEDPYGVHQLSRWRPLSAEPEVVRALPPSPGLPEGAVSPSLDLIEDAYSQTFPDGSAALVYRVENAVLPYRLIVVDPQLRPVLRRQSARPMHALAGPDGDTLWLIETDPHSSGGGNQILVLRR